MKHLHAWRGALPLGSARSLVVGLLALGLAGCATQGAYEAAARDAASAKQQLAQRDQELAALRTQVLELAASLPAELRRRSEIEQALASELALMRERRERADADEAIERSSKGEASALRRKLAELERQQRGSLARIEELKVELGKLQKGARPASTTGTRPPHIELDIKNPWQNL